MDGIKSIYSFFKNCQDEKTIYIRFDDDIAWVHPQAVKNLLDFRVANARPLLVFGNIINNSICTHIHQRIGAVPLMWGANDYSCMSELGWKSGDFSEKIHNYFLEQLQKGTLDRYYFESWILQNYERFSINFFAWFGSDFKKFNGEIGIEEEEYLACTKPQMLGRPNVVCGSALVSHFAFYVQRAYLEEKTNILERYHALAKTLG